MDHIVITVVHLGEVRFVHRTGFRLKVHGDLIQVDTIPELDKVVIYDRHDKPLTWPPGAKLPSRIQSAVNINIGNLICDLVEGLWGVQ